MRCGRGQAARAGGAARCRQHGSGQPGPGAAALPGPAAGEPALRRIQLQVPVPATPGGDQGWKLAGWGGRGGGGRGSPALRARPELGGLGAGEGVLPRARWRWQAAGAAAPQGPALGQLQPYPGWARCLSSLPHAVPEVELKVWSTL